MATTNLSSFNNDWYKPGASYLKRALWYLVSGAFVNSRFPLSGVKVGLLRLFGAKIGKNVVIKPSVNIKSPWLLEIGDHSWIGEHVWIDNLILVKIGSNCCVSQISKNKVNMSYRNNLSTKLISWTVPTTTSN